MITQQSWMSLPSFLELRKKVCHSNLIVSLLQMGSHSFDEISGEVVASVSFYFQAAIYTLDTQAFSLICKMVCVSKKKSICTLLEMGDMKQIRICFRLFQTQLWHMRHQKKQSRSLIGYLPKRNRYCKARNADE